MDKIPITILFLLFPLILLSQQVNSKTDTIPPRTNITNLPQAKEPLRTNNLKRNTNLFKNEYQSQDEDSQRVIESQGLATAKDILYGMKDRERADWDREAKRKVRAFYNYLGYIFDSKVSNSTRKEAISLARDLFVKDSTIIFCDSVLIEDRGRITHHNIDSFFDKLSVLKLDSDGEILINWNIIHSNEKFDSANIERSNLIEFKAMKLTESIYISDPIENNCDSTKMVEIYFTIQRKHLHGESIISNEIKLGNVSFSK